MRPQAKGAGPQRCPSVRVVTRASPGRRPGPLARCARVLCTTGAGHSTFRTSSSRPCSLNAWQPRSHGRRVVVDATRPKSARSQRGRADPQTACEASAACGGRMPPARRPRTSCWMGTRRAGMPRHRASKNKNKPARQTHAASLSPLPPTYYRGRSTPRMPPLRGGFWAGAKAPEPQSAPSAYCRKCGDPVQDTSSVTNPETLW